MLRRPNLPGLLPYPKRIIHDLVKSIKSRGSKNMSCALMQCVDLGYLSGQIFPKLLYIFALKLDNFETLSHFDMLSDGVEFEILGRKLDY